MNIVLKVAYDGSSYLGWQKTKMGQSIEETLSQALSQILNEEIFLQAASRTDAGVHAAGQIVNFFTVKPIASPPDFKIQVTCLLPEDITVTECSIAPDDFHPSLDASWKEYIYELCYGDVQLPFTRNYSWHFPYPLHLAEMQAAARLLLGTHNFRSFCNVRKPEGYSCYERSLYQLNIIDLGSNRLRFEIRGNHFLYKMVRNLVGTLVYVGCGKMKKEQIPGLLAGKQRNLAGVTAPACGLTLHRIHYGHFVNEELFSCP